MVPAVQEIFSVYLDGGIKSLLSKSERVENVKSVILINDVLFQYVLKFRSEYSITFGWPTIDLADGSFHTILIWPEISARRSMGKELSIQHPNGLFLDEEIDPEYIAVNSDGDVAVRGDPDVVKAGA